MECQTFQQAAPRIRTNNKISLEEYLDFVDSLKQIDLTVNYLNQIIDMHGFKKIHKIPKKVLIDAVNSIELMDSSRSTLEDNHISSCAFINLDEVIKDLADLKWQECCITSIQTLNSVNYNLIHQCADPSSKPKPNPKRQRKMRKLKTINGVTATTNTAAIDYVSGSPACSSAVGDDHLKKLIPKKKRKMMMMMKKKKNKKTNDGDLGATVDDQIVSRSSISVSPGSY